MKMQGAFVHGKWFCCDDCGNKDPETQKLKEMFEKGIEFNNDEGEPDEDEEVEIDL